jgi:hypothetical protein
MLTQSKQEMQNTTFTRDGNDSASRSLALEQLDENKKQIKLKLKPKKRSNLEMKLLC